MKKIFAAAAVVLVLSSCSAYNGKNVRKAVAEQMEQYPASTLVDLYKFFYQDIYGPGHMITDLEQVEPLVELDRFQQWGTPYGNIIYEKTGVEGNYYRLAMYSINVGLVETDEVVDAFIRSARKNTPADAAKLRKVWPMVAQAAAEYDIPGYEEDLKELNALVESDNPDKDVHHSDAYKKAYNPHYRLISKKIFLKEILPGLDM